MIELKRALNLAIGQLEPYSESARIDAEVLLAHVLDKTRTYLYAHPEVSLTSEDFFAFEQLVTRRSLGMPVAYILGTREFWSLPIQVNNKTLIPRPETELLVELTLSLVHHQHEARVLDLGTGSGAIALALAKERIDWQITACDCSAEALQTAKNNAQHLGFYNISFCKSDWFSELDDGDTYHAIVSNPPYIAANDPYLSCGDIRFEPQIALVAGKQGFAALEHIIQNSFSRLKKEGVLLLEHGYEQKAAVSSMLNAYGYYDVQCWPDIQGHDRVSTAKKL